MAKKMSMPKSMKSGSKTMKTGGITTPFTTAVKPSIGGKR